MARELINRVIWFGHVEQMEDRFSQNCCGLIESKKNKAYRKAGVHRVSEDRCGKKGQT
jgi:hypothetical protein